MMDWNFLLSDARLERPDAIKEEGRSPFQQDLDRIVFSSAFRRLAHKTQVHPLAVNDHVHTRLTHSIEVASVGRSLGTTAGFQIARELADKSISEDAFGYIVQAACLAHDIGNPPFGHSGEASIAKWFSKYFENPEHRRFDLDDRQKSDFIFFEGNAQGFRIITQLENRKWNGGLQLTHAVLGAFCKYPHSSQNHPVTSSAYKGCEKIGFFKSEERYFQTIANSLQLIRKENYWCRHPLAFLVEAADDICYAIVDIEDGFELRYLSFAEAKCVLEPIAGDAATIFDGMSEREKVAKWRAVAIGNLVKAVSKAFMEQHVSILDGTFGGELIKETPYNSHISEAKSIAKKRIYWSDKKTEIEIAADEILSGLLAYFVPITEEFAASDWNTENLSRHSQNLTRLIMPDGFRGVSTHYDALLRVTDFISGMTDRYALELYRKLKGISL